MEKSFKKIIFNQKVLIELTVIIALKIGKIIKKTLPNTKILIQLAKII